MTQLHLDLAVRTPMNASWSFGGNAGHAALLLRKDVARQLQICRDEAGFRHVRCEGILSDAMGVAQGGGSSFDFTRVERALDMLMESSLTPFVVVSPRDVPAAGVDAGCWHELVKMFATMVDGRYGCDAREWYFEIEDDGATTSPDGGNDPAAGFLRYDVAARAIKEVHPEFRIGRRMSGAQAEIDAFLSHVTMPSEEFKLDVKRCDFLTMHAFAGDNGASSADAAAGAADAGATTAVDRVALVRRKLTEVLGSDVPLICSTGNRRHSPLTHRHDECNGAAGIARGMVEMADSVQGLFFHDLSDICAENEQHCEPFHGGHGLMTVNDIRKAGFHAARLLGEHRGYHNQRVETRWTDPLPGLGCLASVEEYTLRVLCWYHRDPSAPTGGSSKPAKFTIEGLKSTIQNAQVEVIRPGAGSAYESWVEAGRPEFANLQTLHDLEVASQPASVEVDFREVPPRLEPGMVMQMTISLPYEENWSD